MLMHSADEFPQMKIQVLFIYSAPLKYLIQDNMNPINYLSEHMQPYLKENMTWTAFYTDVFFI